MAVVSQKDIVDIVKTNIELLGIVIETIDKTPQLNSDKSYDEKKIKTHIDGLFGKEKNGVRSGGLIRDIALSANSLHVLTQIPKLNSKKIKNKVNVVTVAIEDIINQVEENISEHGDDVMSKFKTSVELLGEFVNLSDNIKKLETIQKINHKQVNKNIESLFKCIDVIAEVVNKSKQVDSGKVELAIKNTESISKLITALVDMYQGVKKLAMGLPLLILCIGLATLSIIILIGFLWVVSKLLFIARLTVSINTVITILMLKFIFSALKSVQLNVIIFALLTPIFVIAAFIAILGILVLALLIWIVAYVFRWITRQIVQTLKNLMLVTVFFLVITLAMIVIILLLIGVSYLVDKLIERLPQIMEFLLIIGSFVSGLVLLGKLLNKFRTTILKSVAIYKMIVMILVELLLMSAILFAVALIAEHVNNHIADLLKFFLELAVIVAALVVLGGELTLAIIPLGIALVGLAAVTVILLEILAVIGLLKAIQESAEALDTDKIHTSIGAVGETSNIILDELGDLCNPIYAIQFALIMTALAPLTLMMYEIESTIENLEKLQKYELDMKKITNNITCVSEVSNIILDKFDSLTSLEALVDVNLIQWCTENISEIIEALIDVAEALNKFLQKSNFDVKQAMVQMTLIIDAANETLEQAQKFGGFENLIDLNILQWNIENIVEIVEAINKLSEVLSELAKINIKEKTITDKVENVFKCVDEVESRAKERLSASNIFELWFSDWRTTAITEIERTETIVNMINSISEKLSELEDRDIDRKKVNNFIDDVWEVIDHMSEKISERFSGKGFWETIGSMFTTSAEEEMSDFLERIISLIDVIKVVVNELNEMVDVRIKTKQIIKRVDEVWEIIDKIETDLIQKMGFDGKGFWETVGGVFTTSAEEELADHLGRVSEILKILTTTVKLINDLAELKIRKSKVFKSIDKIWEIIDEVEEDIKSRLPAPRDMWQRIGDWWNGEGANQEEEYKEHLGRVTQIIDIIQAVVEALQGLADLDISESDILKRMTFVWTVIGRIEGKIKEWCTPKKQKGAWDSIVDFFTGRDEEDKSADDVAYLAHLGRVGAIVKIIRSITEALNQIQNYKLSSHKIDKALNDIFECIDKITEKLKSELANLSSDWSEMGDIIRKQSNKNLFDNISSFAGLWGFLDDMLIGLSPQNHILKLFEFISGAVTSIVTIAKGLETLGDFDVNLDKALDNIVKISTQLVAIQHQIFAMVTASGLNLTIYNNGVEVAHTAENIGEALEHWGEAEDTFTSGISNFLSHIMNIVEVFNKLQNIKPINAKYIIQGLRDLIWLVFKVIPESIWDFGDGTTLKTLVDDLNGELETNAPGYDKSFTSLLKGEALFSYLGDALDIIKDGYQGITETIKFFDGLNKVSINVKGLQDNLQAVLIDVPMALHEVMSGEGFDLSQIKTVGENCKSIFNDLYKHILCPFSDGEIDLEDLTSKSEEQWSALKGVAKYNLSSSGWWDEIKFVYITVPERICKLADKQMTTESKQKVGELFRFISTLNSGVAAMGENNGIDNFREIVDCTDQLVTKVNEVQVDNLKYAAALFEKMAIFTVKISENIENVREVLADIIPILEKTNEVMDKRPQMSVSGTPDTPTTSNNSSNRNSNSNASMQQMKVNDPSTNLSEVISQLGSLLEVAEEIKAAIE